MDYILDSEAIDANAGYKRLMQAFIKKIQHPAAKTELSDGAQGFEVLKTALNAHRSANSGGLTLNYKRGKPSRERYEKSNQILALAEQLMQYHLEPRPSAKARHNFLFLILHFISTEVKVAMYGM